MRQVKYYLCYILLNFNTCYNKIGKHKNKENKLKNRNCKYMLGPTKYPQKCTVVFYSHMKIFLLNIRQTDILLCPVYCIIKYICCRKIRKTQICFSKIKISHNSTDWDDHCHLLFSVYPFQFIPFLYILFFFLTVVGLTLHSLFYNVFSMSIHIHLKHRSLWLKFMKFLDVLFLLVKP